ncbi:unnamed protein product [Brassica rapa]|uniref:Uncharacterized protein n=1 Tax=Brassica campestris TaxID=3711 RepID=A0A8D9LWW8_BRACM|nr:unnamed protein product [Brassica rapa]
MERVRTTASMCIPHIATMQPNDMNRVCYINQTFSQTPIFCTAVRGEDGPAELQQKLCQ